MYDRATWTTYFYDNDNLYLDVLRLKLLYSLEKQAVCLLECKILAHETKILFCYTPILRPCSYRVIL